MKIFLDANVILDTYDEGRPSFKYSLKVYEYMIINKFKLFTSCDLITTIYYVSSKKDKSQALLNIKDTNKILTIIKFSNKEIEETCDLMLEDSDFKDLEDTIQYVMAKKEECDMIISNDKKFISKEIKLMSSKEFYNKYINIGSHDEVY